MILLSRKFRACLVGYFKHNNTHFHRFFSPTRISKTPKQHYSNSSTKHTLNYPLNYWLVVTNIKRHIIAKSFAKSL